MARDIFKDGPSPELLEYWGGLEKLETDFFAAGEPERVRMLREFPELRIMVMCEECGQVLPEGQTDLG